MRYLLSLLILFSSLSVGATNSAPTLVTPQQKFIKRLLPDIVAKNNDLERQRQQLTDLYQQWQKKQSFNVTQVQELNKLKLNYKINNTLSEQQIWTCLFKRVDIIPTSLVIAQAINESAWGKSRFAKDGNNYFGEWCYTKGCGLVPKQRSKGAHHEVRRFASSKDSIASYIHNLNTHSAYQKFRQLRAQLRAKHQILNSKYLLTSLTKYSQLKGEYIKRINSLINRYNLLQYDITSIRTSS